MKHIRLGLFGLLTLGTLLRFYGLGGKSLWYDEAVSWNDVGFSISETLSRSLEPRRVHPPLFFLALRLWSCIWGDSEFALRSLAAICGVLTLAGVYLLVAELTRSEKKAGRIEDGAALLAAALVTLSPLQIHLSRQVRGYSLGTLLLVFGGWALLRALQGGRHCKSYWILFATLALMSSYTHNLALLSLASQGVFAAIAILAEPRCEPPFGELVNPPSTDLARSGSAKTRKAGKIPPWSLVALSIFIVGYILPWLSRLLAQGQTIRQGNVSPLRADDIPGQVVRALCFTQEIAGSDVTLAAWPVSILLAASFIGLAIRGKRAGWYLMLTGVLPPLLMIAFSLNSNRSIVRARYLCFSQVSWLAGIAVLIASVLSITRRSVLIGLSLAVSLYCCYESWSVIGPSANPGFRAAMGHVRDRLADDEPIVAKSPYVFFGAKYYLRGIRRPLLCLNEADRDSGYASEQLSETELTTAVDVINCKASGVWNVDSESYGAKHRAAFEIPPDWILRETTQFKQDYQRLEKPVIVQHFIIRRQPTSGLPQTPPQTAPH